MVNNSPGLLVAIPLSALFFRRPLSSVCVYVPDFDRDIQNKSRLHTFSSSISKVIVNRFWTDKIFNCSVQTGITHTHTYTHTHICSSTFHWIPKKTKRLRPWDQSCEGKKHLQTTLPSRTDSRDESSPSHPLRVCVCVCVCPGEYGARALPVFLRRGGGRAACSSSRSEKKLRRSSSPGGQSVATSPYVLWNRVLSWEGTKHLKHHQENPLQSETKVLFIPLVVKQNGSVWITLSGKMSFFFHGKTGPDIFLSFVHTMKISLSLPLSTSLSPYLYISLYISLSTSYRDRGGLSPDVSSRSAATRTDTGEHSCRRLW